MDSKIGRGTCSKFLGLTDSVVWILLGSILLLGLLLRLYGIEWSLPDELHPFTTYLADELWALQGIKKLNPFNYNPEPLCFLQGTFLFYVVGSFLGLASFLRIITLTPESVFYGANPSQLADIYLAGRLVNVLIGVATVYLVFLLAKNLFGRRVGLLSSLFLAILPSHVQNSHYLRTDILMTFLIVAAILILFKILESSKTVWYILAGLTTGLAIATKYTGLFALALPVITTYMLSRGKWTGVRSLLMNKKLFILLASVPIGFSVGCPGAIVSPDIFARGVILSFEGTTSGAFFDSYGTGSGWLDFYFNFSYGMGIPLFVLSGIGVIMAFLKRKKTGL